MSVTKRYYVRKKEIDNNRMIDGRKGSASELLDIKQYIEQVVDEHLTIDNGILSSTTDLELTAAEDLTITGGTALTLSLALGDIGLNATDGNIINSASLAITSTATGGDHTISSTTGEVDITATAANVDINAGTNVTMNTTAGDIILTAGGGNITFALASIPTHADDTAAGVGGLTAGEVYKTATGVLMIKL